VKRDGQTVWFDVRKLRDSLSGAAHRLVAPKSLDLIGESIERSVIEAQRPVATEEIRAWVEDRLWKVSDLAGIRYAAGAPDATLGRLLRRITGVDRGHVRKRNGELEPFERRKLVRSVRLALGKRRLDGAAVRDAERFADGLARATARAGDPVPTADIGERSLAWLRAQDDVAFLSYLMRHRGLDAEELAQGLRTKHASTDVLRRATERHVPPTNAAEPDSAER
jgi:transcriptional regulator NrdR family protein